MTTPEISVLEEKAPVAIKNRNITVGLPANLSRADRRFPLTPEAVNILVDKYRFKVFIEKNAGADIHYSDNAYTKCGAITADRSTVLHNDIVISVPPLSQPDVAGMRRSSTLWTVTEPEAFNKDLLKSLNHQSVTTVSLSALTESDGRKPVSDILDEVDGRATIAVASGFLADAERGKGILLGGIAGIVPCEVTIIGAGTAGVAAAKSAVGLGATVRLFDDDFCRLRNAGALLNGSVITSSLHRRVYLNALASADIVINTLQTDVTDAARIDSSEIDILKKGAILFDLGRDNCPAFPSLKKVDLRPALRELPPLTERICFINPGSAVPRTAAMALSNMIVPLLSRLAVGDDRTFMDAVRMDTYLRSGLITFGGKVVNREAAEASGLKWVDPAIYLHLS